MHCFYTEMVEMLGQDDARAVVHRLSGKRIYVPYPRTLTRNHKLAKALGFNRATRFCVAFAGDTICIPSLATIRRAELVACLNRLGMATDEIAWFADASQRHVQRILAKPLPKVK